MDTLDSICDGEWRQERDGQYECTAADHIGELNFETRRELISYDCPYCKPRMDKGYPLCGMENTASYNSE